jgi:hypothetical protein
VRRVWIGLDFGAFALPDSRPAALQQPWSVADRRATAWRYGLIHPRAMRATLLALADPGGCAAPPFSAAGFARRGLTPGEAAAHDLHPDVGAQARTRASWQAEAAQRERFSAGRFALLDALLGELKRRRIAVVLFLTPSPSSYRTLVAEAGLAGDYERWRRRAFAYDDRAGGIVVVPADSPEFLRSVAQARCAGADPDACLFYDRAHARPVLGAAIVRAAGARP